MLFHILKLPYSPHCWGKERLLILAHPSPTSLAVEGAEPGSVLTLLNAQHLCPPGSRMGGFIPSGGAGKAG